MSATAIRNRPSSVLRKVRDLLVSGMAAELGDINTDLDSEPGGYTVDTAIDSVRIAGQDLVYPVDTPSIRVLIGSVEDAPTSTSNIALSRLSIQLHIFVHINDVTRVVAPPPLQPDGDPEDEDILVMATMDYIEAVKRVLTVNPNGLMGNAKIYDIKVVTQNINLYDITDEEYPVAMHGVVVLTVLQRKRY